MKVSVKTKNVRNATLLMVVEDDWKKGNLFPRNKSLPETAQDSSSWRPLGNLCIFRLLNRETGVYCSSEGGGGLAYKGNGKSKTHLVFHWIKSGETEETEEMYNFWTTGFFLLCCVISSDAVFILFWFFWGCLFLLLWCSAWQQAIPQGRSWGKIPRRRMWKIYGRVLGWTSRCSGENGRRRSVSVLQISVIKGPISQGLLWKEILSREIRDWPWKKMPV